MNDVLSPRDYADIAALAWHVVKGASDPELPNCAIDHQHRFIWKVESVHKSGKRDEHDNGFDLVARNLLDCPRDKWQAFTAAVFAAEGSIQERIKISAELLREPIAPELAEELSRFGVPQSQIDRTENPPTGISPIINGDPFAENETFKMLQEKEGN